MSSVSSDIISIDAGNEQLAAKECPEVYEYRNDQLGIRVFSSWQNYSENIDVYKTCAKIYVDLRVKLYITFNLLNHGLKTVWEKIAFDKFCNDDRCKFISIPINDYSTIDPLIFVHFWEILDEFNESRKISGNENDEVLLHCTSGNGRTAFMIMSYICLKKIKNNPHRFVSAGIKLYDDEPDPLEKTKIFKSYILGNSNIKFLIDEMTKFRPYCIHELTNEILFVKRIKNLILALSLYTSKPSKNIEYEKKIKGDEMFEKKINKELLLKIVNGLYEQIMINDRLYKYLEKNDVEHVKINTDKSFSINKFYNVNKMYIYGSYALNVYKNFLELILGTFVVDDYNLFPKPVDYDIMLCFKDLGIHQDLTIDELKKIFINIFREYFEKNYDELNKNNFFQNIELIMSNPSDINSDNQEETLFVYNSKIELVIINTPAYKVFRINLAINVNGNIYKNHIIEFKLNFLPVSGSIYDLYNNTKIVLIEFDNKDKYLVPEFSSLILFNMKSLIIRGKTENSFWKCNKDFHRLKYFKDFLIPDVKRIAFLSELLNLKIYDDNLDNLTKLLNFVKKYWYYCTYKIDPKYYNYVLSKISEHKSIPSLLYKYGLNNYFNNTYTNSYANKYLKYKKKYVIKKI